MMSIFTRDGMFCEISRYELLPVSVGGNHILPSLHFDIVRIFRRDRKR